MKFGKYLEGHQLELPEHNGYFIDYKALKKLIKQLAVPSTISTNHEEDDILDDRESLVYQRLQGNQSIFFFKLERELEKVNSYYLTKKLDLQVNYDILKDKYESHKRTGKLLSKDSVSYKTLLAAIKHFQRNLNSFEQYVELNRTGFLKALKKWDKRSHSQQKEFYFATVVSVQPIFNNNDISKINDSTLALLVDLDNIHNEENTNMYQPQNDSSILETGIDSEIENWYKEILNISHLKDADKKIEILQELGASKIQKQLETLDIQDNVDQKLLFKNVFTKLFLLLVDSEIDDQSLEAFYLTIKDRIDLAYYNENDQIFSKRNILHDAARNSLHPRLFILKETLRSSPDKIINLINAQDSHLRTPLHYACEQGKYDYVEALIATNCLQTADALDNESRTALVLAIMHKWNNIVRLLLSKAGVNPCPDINGIHGLSKPQFSPIDIACSSNNYEAAKLLLEIGNIDLTKCHNLEGLPTLHTVAKVGGSTELIRLLVKNGEDPNGFDDIHKWTPIFYAVHRGHCSTLEALLDCGASADVLDDNNMTPLCYAVWEGQIGIVNALLKRRSMSIKNISENMLEDKDLESISSLGNSLEDIPEFTLPPPIMPLRKYGHNYLDKKILLKLMLKKGTSSIQLNNDDEALLSGPGRITLTSNLPDGFPRNIIMPIGEEEDGEVVFYVDSLEKFVIDFEVFPKFGTKLLAKTTAMPLIFSKTNANGNGSITLPLFGSKLKNVGALKFDIQVIYPYLLKPLEISKYETYWKSTKSDTAISNNDHQFVTSSSLQGIFITIKVVSLNDGTLVVVPRFYLEILGTKLLFNDLSKAQVEKLCSYKLDEITAMDDSFSLKSFLGTKICTLEKLLKVIPPSIQLAIHIGFPTTQEIEQVPVKMSPFLNANDVTENLLLTVFEHIRDLRHSDKEQRSIVFVSYNRHICSLLNWKQPNFPVFFKMGGIYKENSYFLEDTVHRLKQMATLPSKVSRNGSPYFSIRDIVRFASNDNLLGVIIPLDLLDLSPNLISKIRARGLLLIGSDNTKDVLEPREEIHGVYSSTELVFSGDMDTTQAITAL